LRVLCANARLEGDFNFNALAKATPGYVGADLAALTDAAGIIAVKRICKQISDGTLALLDPEPQVVESEEEQDTSMAIGNSPPTVDVILYYNHGQMAQHHSYSSFLASS
jgi:ribosome biogenesis ATPase